MKAEYVEQMEKMLGAVTITESSRAGYVDTGCGVDERTAAFEIEVSFTGSGILEIPRGRKEDMAETVQLLDEMGAEGLLTRTIGYHLDGEERSSTIAIAYEVSEEAVLYMARLAINRAVIKTTELK